MKTKDAPKRSVLIARLKQFPSRGKFWQPQPKKNSPTESEQSAWSAVGFGSC
ncbi:MAG: hypothetical protein ACRC8Y_16325 [Chroococcales cyanobacterium]